MSHPGRDDPTPLTPAQLWALIRAATRELSWGTHQVTREMRRWRARAERIPSGPIREDALYALTHKRTHAEGAALFSTLPAHRDSNLLRLLTAYELILDFLDNVNERHRTEVNGRELHLALLDAVDPGRVPSDYYRHHPWKDDGGYLKALVESCQQRCRALPSYDQVRVLVLREAGRFQVLALNHLIDPVERDAALERWATLECPEAEEFGWYELASAASGSLVVLALLTLAARENVTAGEIEKIQHVYWPLTSLVAVMLDSYADQDEDAVSGDHSYVAHYPSDEERTQRLATCIGTASHGALSLPDGHKHAVIVSAMVAMYLSKDSARAPERRRETQALVAAGGSLARLLVPVLRLWRIAYSHRGN
jgi:tetraprenyl-beta-curcumene synthase